ncbi:MAG: class I SAM-dependent methyltransferase [Verrucomicrobiales bacterium]
MSTRNYGNIDEDSRTHQEHVARMTAYYAETASKYNSWHCDPSNISSHNFAARETISLMEEVGGKTLLDVCCGTGRAVKMAIDHGYSAKGIDISSDLVRIGVQELGIAQEHLDVGDATDLPYEDNSFDVSCIYGALHHTAQPRRIVSEMTRVSRKGIVISDEGNHLTGGFKALLTALGVFDPVYRVVFRRAPREGRRMTVSDGDGPTFVFSVEEIIPQLREAFSVMKCLTFYRVGRFQSCSFRYPRLFAKQVVVIARKNSEG